MLIEVNCRNYADNSVHTSKHNIACHMPTISEKIFQANTVRCSFAEGWMYHRQISGNHGRLSMYNHFIVAFISRGKFSNFFNSDFCFCTVCLYAINEKSTGMFHIMGVGGGRGAVASPSQLWRNFQKSALFGQIFALSRAKMLANKWLCVGPPP